MKRKSGYRRHWGKLVKHHGSLCFYCEQEPASSIDHIIPVSFGGKDNFDNLVPACIHCNLVASGKVFDDVWSKKQYIQNRRKRKLTHAVCTDCLIPFRYRFHSPSLFLCPVCYDKLNNTNRRKSKKWKEWLIELNDAGFILQAHSKAKEEIKNLPGSRDRKRLSFIILHKYMALMGVYDNEKETV